MTDNPFVKPSAQITDAQLVKPKQRPGGGVSLVVLERVEPGVTPEYCIHGKTTCYAGCGNWLWLGDETHEIVKSGEAAGICIECMTALGERMRAAGDDPEKYRRGHLHDHRRADGPH